MNSSHALLLAFLIGVVKFPSTPSRTALPGLIGRSTLGALSGASVAAAGAQSTVLGAILGAAGGIAGAYAGYEVRARLVRALKVRTSSLRSWKMRWRLPEAFSLRRGSDPALA